MEQWLVYWLITICFSVVDITATIWTIEFMKKHPEELEMARAKRIKDPNKMETSFIPSLLLKWKAPKIVFYMFVLGLTLLAFKFGGFAKELMFFMMGAYMVILQIHWANFMDLKDLGR